MPQHAHGRRAVLHFKGVDDPAMIIERGPCLFIGQRVIRQHVQTPPQWANSLVQQGIGGK